MPSLIQGQSTTQSVAKGSVVIIDSDVSSDYLVEVVSGLGLRAGSKLVRGGGRNIVGPFDQAGSVKVSAIRGSLVTIKTTVGNAAPDIADALLNPKTGQIIPPVRTHSDLVYALAWLSDDPIGGYILGGDEIVIESPIRWNTAKAGLRGNAVAINCGNLTGNSKAITLFYSHDDYTGYRRYNFAPYVMSEFTLIGPGFNSAADIAGGNGTSGIYTDGEVVSPANKAVRPVLRDFSITGFDNAFDMNNVSFLGTLTNYIGHDNGVYLRQRSATDSGEMVRLIGGLNQRNRLGYLLEDGSSEVVHSNASIDYGRQVTVINTGSSWGRLTLRDCHWETRGAYDGDDAVGYVIEGTGTVTDAIIPGRDAVFDIDGIGSQVLLDGTSLDLNTNGLPGGSQPWANLACLAKTRHKTCGIILRNCPPQSLANTAQLFMSGLGHISYEGGQLMFPSDLTLPHRKSNNPIHNKLYHGAFPSSQIGDLWSIRRDAAEITDRFTGTNGSLARDNSVTRAITIGPALTLSGTGTGTRTVTSTVDAFTPDMLGRNFVVGSGVGAVTSVDSLRQMTLNVTAAFASTAISAGTAVARNSAGLRVTKAAGKIAGDNFEVACFAPVVPGERVTIHGYYWVPASGAVTGTPAVNYRWTRLTMPKVAALAGTSAATWTQTIPTQGSADTAGTDWDLGFNRSSVTIRTTDLALSPTGQWIEFYLTIPNSTGAGEMQAPDWATHVEFGINLNACGAGNIFFTDLTVSGW